VAARKAFLENTTDASATQCFDALLRLRDGFVAASEAYAKAVKSIDDLKKNDPDLLGNKYPALFRKKNHFADLCEKRAGNDVLFATAVEYMRGRAGLWAPRAMLAEEFERLSQPPPYIPPVLGRRDGTSSMNVVGQPQTRAGVPARSRTASQEEQGSNLTQATTHQRPRQM